jgi:cell division protein FtsL
MVRNMIDVHNRKPIDNSRVVRHAAPNRLREMGRLMGLGTLFALVALLYAWQHFNCIQLSYQLEALKGERSIALELNQELKLEEAGLRAPSRIDDIARKQLGLTMPVPGQVAPFEAPGEPVFAEMHPAGQTRSQ